MARHSRDPHVEIHGAIHIARRAVGTYGAEGGARASRWLLLPAQMVLLLVTFACAPTAATIPIPSTPDHSSPTLSLFVSQDGARGAVFQEAHRTTPYDLGRIPADRQLTFRGTAHNARAGIRYVRIDATFTTTCRTRENQMEVEVPVSISEVFGQEVFTPPTTGQAVPTTRTGVAAFPANAVDAACSARQLGLSQGRTVNGRATVTASTYFGENQSATYLFSFLPPRL